MLRKFSVLLLIGLTSSLAACSSVSSETAATDTETRVPLAVESATPSAEETFEDVTELSDRGNTIMSVGDEIDLTADGQEWATFKIEKITSKVKCTQEAYGEPLAKGHHLVAMTVSVRTEPASAGNTEDFYLSAFSWKYIDTNDVTYNGELAGDASYSCIDEGKLLPDTIGPGEKAKGEIIIDVPSLDGTVAIDEYGVELDLKSALSK